MMFRINEVRHERERLSAKIRFVTLALVFLMAWPMRVLANSDKDLSLDSFKKRFILIRENGKLVEVRDRFLVAGFKLKPLLNYYKNLISNEQALISLSPESYKENVQQTFLQTYDETPEYLTDSLVSLQNIDIDKVFNDPKFNEILQKYETRIDEELAKIGLITVASPADPKFFYQRQVIYEITKTFLNMIRSQLEQVPVLNTAMFILKEAERMVKERRTFHQNMLLHYLENFKEEELELTHDEANMIWSSVYESRIAWYAFWESEAATVNWLKYGTDRFFQNMRIANTRLRDQASQYESLGVRHNYAFQDVTLKGKKVIINLFDSRDMFTTKHSIAYYYNNPKLVPRQRMLLQLGQLGLSFVSLPGFIKDMASSFFKSMYERQRLTEGALVGYFESKGQREMATQMVNQNMNPFETYDVSLE